MKRKSIVRGGGEDENGDGGTTKKHSSNSSSNNKRKKTKTNSSPSPPVIGTVATRTRRQTKAIASSWNQPLSILINIMSYADPETIRLLCCVSKQFYDLITNNPGLEHNRVIPLLQISPAEDQEDDKGRQGRLLKQLDRNQNRLHHIRAMKVINPNQFRYSHCDELSRLVNTLQQRFTGVVALDLSSLRFTKTVFTNCFFLATLRAMLPNLREIDLSSSNIQSHQLEEFAEECSRLEKITYNHSSDPWGSCSISRTCMDGKHMSPAKNLREIYMDDSDFYAGGAGWSRKKMSDLENDEYSDIFLFHKCSKGLERVSIKNAKNKTYVGDDGIFSQNVLIKFVRNTPTLKWLRSDLTQDNIDMLRSEQQQRFSKIEFVQ